MKKILLFLSACILGIGQALASNVLTVSDVSVPQGGQATLEIGCAFDTEYTAFELQIVLPDGLSLLKDEDGYPVIEKAFDTNHLLTSKHLPSNGNYMITCFSTENLSMPTSGALFRVTVLAEEEMTIGTNLTASVTACEFTRTSNSSGDYLSDIDFNITIGAPEDPWTTLDENSTTSPVASDGEVEIKVKRSIKGNQWNTICLPFAMTAEQVSEVFGSDVELAEFDSYEVDDEKTSITVNFVDADLSDGFLANYPYLIKTSSDINEFMVTSTIEPDEENAVAEYAEGRGAKRHVYGTFIGSFHANTTVPAAKLFISNNKFYYSKGETKMKGYRAYFDLEDVIDAYYGNSPQQAPIRVMLNGHDDFTAIDVVDMNIRYQEGIYTLSGMKVKNAERGVFIKNGKKYTLK